MIYELDGHRPDLPAEALYWIAPNATVIGKVRLKPRLQHLVRRGVAR